MVAVSVLNKDVMSALKHIKKELQRENVFHDVKAIKHFVSRGKKVKMKLARLVKQKIKERADKVAKFSTQATTSSSISPMVLHIGQFNVRVMKDDVTIFNKTTKKSINMKFADVNFDKLDTYF